MCDEMAARARFNIEAIVERLTAQGFVFHSNDDDRALVVPFRPAGPRGAEAAGWLESELGPIPLVIESWMRLVGDVWFVGSHPEWDEAAEADPFVIELEGGRYANVRIEDYWASEYEAWKERVAEDATAERFVLPVAPDRLHKSNVSGGEPYGVRLPDACADGVFVAEAEVSFVAYLNQVFANGGFPAQTGGANEAEIKRSLAAGLLGA
ncbi:hypothetical protein [Leifsonia sp. TF02-11]|uniref:hypothetical protein n=1 Tax=Leifsonia sp. TF02-11 TaxID=2815212 RepID=UPI001AA13F57|nr:hypothetical protein [Leifsonia sp. TF02-11]MBO1738232.1 hypothetical protein [Leifsonia sp. TF02-11]